MSNGLKKGLLTCLILICLLGNAFADEYKVMAWNVEDMDIFDGQGTDRLPDQLQKESSFASVIKNVNPDILFLVEAPNLIELRHFVYVNNLDYQVAHVRQQKGNRSFADGMGLLVKHGLSLKDVSLETPPIPGSNRPPASRYLDWSYRGLTVAKISNITFIGVHLKSPGSDPETEDLEKRYKQAQGLVTYVVSISGPIVVAGDFNDGPGIGDVETNLNQPDTMAVFSGLFTRAAGNEATQKGGFNIDHILVRDATVGNRTVETTPWSLSDHRPVWAVVTTN